MTALHHAIDSNSDAHITELLSHKDVDPNTTDKYGRTPLRVAVEYSRPKCVEALLTHKDINIHLKDDQSRTLLQVAELLLEVESDETYLDYQHNYEIIVALFHAFPL